MRFSSHLLSADARGKSKILGGHATTEKESEPPCSLEISQLGWLKGMDLESQAFPMIRVAIFFF
jgi:hypothetical protein